MFFSSVKEINMLSKGMSKISIEKNWHSQNFNFLGKKIWRNALALKSKKVQGIFGENYFGIIVFSCLSSRNLCLRFLLICYAREIKAFSDLPRKWGWFYKHMNVSQNI